jgi:glycosyltransferase involved in cell wall biosynthesis
VRIHRYRTFEARSRRAAFVLEFGWCWTRTLLLALRVAWRDGFDVIHACNPPDTFFAIALVFRLFGKRFIYDQHDLCPELYLSKVPQGHGDLLYRGLLTLERLTYRAADAVIATNESYRQMAIARGNVDPVRVFVVRNGPDRERIREELPDPSVRNGARHLLGYLGTMSTQDGVDTLLRVLARIVYQHGRRDVHLVLVGGGPLLDELRRLAEQLGLRPHVTFTGRIPDGEHFRRVLCSTDVCVSPDPPNPLNELSTMNKTLEYMAFGRPVVAFALKETVVSSGDAALYARPGDEVDLAEKILSLLDDPAKRAELGRRGQARVWNHLCWERSVPQLLAAYRFALTASR